MSRRWLGYQFILRSVEAYAKLRDEMCRILPVCYTVGLFCLVLLLTLPCEVIKSS